MKRGHGNNLKITQTLYITLQIPWQRLLSRAINSSGEYKCYSQDKIPIAKMDCGN